MRGMLDLPATDQLALQLRRFGRLADQALDDAGDMADQQQGFQPTLSMGARARDALAEAFVLRVTETLLDTHALLWWVQDNPQLSARARTAIASFRNEIYVSAASAWEIATKVRIGKLRGADAFAADFRNGCNN